MIIAKLICEQMHITETQVHNPVVHTDGMVEGYVGSSGFYCDVCDSSEMTVLGAYEVPR